jgi:MFS family permease
MRSFATNLRHPKRMYYGWRMLALVSFMGAVNNSFYSRGATIFLIPVETSLALNRATSSLIFSLARSEGALGGPAVGYLVDRFGTRRMLIIGTVLAGVGFIIFATATNVWIFAVAYMLFISFGATMAFEDAMMAMVNKWFSRFRVRAMAIREASGNLGATAMVPVMVLVIAAYSWRTAAVMAACAYLVIVLPLSRFLRESPESIGLLPDGVTPEEVAAARRVAGQRRSGSVGRGASYVDQVDYTVKEALRTRGYWSLLVGTMLRQTSRAAVEVHLIAIFQWKGLEPATAGLIYTLWVGMNVPSKLLFGYFGDRAPKQAVLGGGMLLYVAAFVLLLASDWVWFIALAAVIGGTSEGITPINWGTVGDYFGRRHYATLRGFIGMSYSWAWLVMPFASGWWFDHHASYGVPLVVASVVAIVSACAYASMRRPKLPARLSPVS